MTYHHATPNCSWPELSAWAHKTDATDVVIWWTRHDHDAIVGLSGLSQMTSKARLGIMVSGLVNKPVLLAAKQVATLDLLSHGRVLIGNDDESTLAQLESTIAHGIEPMPRQNPLPVQRWSEVQLAGS